MPGRGVRGRLLLTVASSTRGYFFDADFFENFLDGGFFSAFSANFLGGGFFDEFLGGERAPPPEPPPLSFKDPWPLFHFPTSQAVAAF
jgi:hypothetical protein